MHLRKAHDKRINKTYLSIVHSYRDENGKPKSKVVKSLGYLNDLQKEYPDPAAHFTEVAKAMEAERKETIKIPITLDMNEKLSLDGSQSKNYGCLVYSKIYHELEIDRFLDNARRHKNFSFNSEAIMRLLVYSRLLNPSSKREAFINKEQFFDKFKCSLDDIYHALDHFHEISEALQKHLHEKVVEQYNRKTKLVYYDVTNYYCEINKQDELRKKGFSKEGRKSPIVQMGLFMDTLGLPISYKLFPGNTHDSQTLMPSLAEIKKRFGVKRLITAADKGLNSGDNIAFNTALNDGYIYSKSVRGASEDFKKWILDEVGYRENTKTTKIKSRVIPDAEIWVSVEQIGKNTKKKKMYIEQKQVAFYSEKYAKRAKHKRDEIIVKAVKMLDNPAKYQRSCDYGAAGYIKNIKIDKETGEIKNVQDKLFLDLEKIKEEEKYDGYYAVVTSELDDSDEHIMEIYKGLWRIEEAFKITKSVLGSRPFWLQTGEHINAHFLICFISLLIARILEIRLIRKFPVSRIIDSIKKVTCSRVQQNIWHFHYRDEVTDLISDVFGLDFGQKFLLHEKIKNNFSVSKKSSL